MLFNSYGFIFIFLPVTLLLFFAIGRSGHYRLALAWLVGASLFFYGWWKPAYLTLILVSILGNHLASSFLIKRTGAHRRFLLALGVSFNLALIGYFKYANFFVDNVNNLFDSNFHLETIILPLAISFFTFQQIAYLVDAYGGEVPKPSFLRYCLFVTFFPQLIAGPIVHHGEMLPEFARKGFGLFRSDNLALGITVFFIGLFKKVIIADGMARYATPVFDAASQGEALTLLEAWGGSLAYTFQLYFDFSGYSDMAIGLGRMFGIRIPLNFDSPYKAVNIIDFWRRWHMTLSRFLRNYLYFPLGGNRKGGGRRYVNLIITMLLGGLWHGAAWTFVAWGALHGIYLIVNHAWRAFRIFLGYNLESSTRLGQVLARALTFVCVLFAWVCFRAETLDAAVRVFEGMLGVNGLVLPAAYLERLGAIGLPVLEPGWHFSFVPHFEGVRELVFLLALFLVTFLAPNTQEMMATYKIGFSVYRDPSLPRGAEWLRWRPASYWAVVSGLITLLALYGISDTNEFLYFQF